ncbi:MAG: tetratricopeptide repeat protein [Trueperaceae bacterium]|nr:tetratricopeptide repeat protein [Trueperaceae bacterium]
MLELKLFGLPRLFYQGKELVAPGSKALAMLCYLSYQTEPVHRKFLAELLWETTKTTSVRVALSELRNLAGADQWLIADGQLLSVRASSDVKTFQEALLAEDYETALACWNESTDPSFLKSLEVKKAADFDDWVAAERSRLSALHLSALQGKLKSLELAHEYEAALEIARQILAKDKLNEDVHRRLMLLEHKRGNTEGAVQQFEILRRVLKDELDVEPLADTLTLLKEIESSSLSSGKTAVILKTDTYIPALAEKLIGRADLLNAIESNLQTHKRLLLHGFGGTGKTALVASFAKHWLDEHRGNILWLQAGDDNPETLFDAISRAFNAQQQLKQTRNPQVTLRHLLADLSLFILDDAWNAYALAKLQEVLPAELPLIVTARQRYSQFKRLDVGRLRRTDALELLNYNAKQTPEPADKQSKYADQLCNLLGDHPLAVRIAGLTLLAEGLSNKDLLERIKENPHSMKTPAEFAEEGRESVANLLSTTAKTLSDPAYEALLGCGSLHTTSTTPELLALALRRDELATEDALIELQKRGLSDRQAQAGSDVISYRLHDLVYSFAKANTNLRATTMMHAGKAFLAKHQKDFDTLDAEIANLLGSVQTAQYEDPDVFIDMMTQLSVGDAYYLARGHSPQSLKLLIRASEQAEKLGNVEAAHYLYARLGDTYRGLYANFEAAFRSYEKALVLAKKITNRHREAAILSLLGITRFECKQTDFDGYFEAAYTIAKAENDNLAISNVLQHRGYVSGRLENWKETLEFSKEAVSVAKKLQDDSREDSLSCYHLFFSLLNQGIAERNLGQIDKALNTKNEALALAQTSNNKIWQAYAFQELGETYHASDKKDLALLNFRKAYQIYLENNASIDAKQIASLLKENNYPLDL